MPDRATPTLTPTVGPTVTPSLLQAGYRLFRVKQDVAYERVWRNGRYQITREEAASPVHLADAIRQAKIGLVVQLEAEDVVAGRHPRHIASVRWKFEWCKETLDQQALLDPVLDKDPGVGVGRPEITNLGHFDRDAMETYSRAERARQAREVGANVEGLVDFRVTGLFEVPVETHYRAHVKETKR